VNRVFYWMIVVALGFAAVRQLAYEARADLSPALLGLFDLAEPADGTKLVAPLEATVNGLFDSAKKAVLDVVLPLVGAMSFFLGLMKVMEKAGGLDVVARVVRPIMVPLFPEVPPDHPAMSAMILNIAANMLGLGNAATPFGLRAMAELDKLNPVKGTATNAMCLFLAINTSGVTLLATGVVAVRKTLGSVDAEAAIPTTLFATMCSTAFAVMFAKGMERWSGSTGAPVSDGAKAEGQGTEAWPLWASLLVMGTLLGAILSTLVVPQAGPWILPGIVFTFLTWGAVKKVPVYEAFVEGARDGWDTAVRIVPYLVAILSAVGMLRGAGVIGLFSRLVGPLTEPFGLPAEALPMVLLRPFSGSGANALMMSILQEHGPDSYLGHLVSTLQGSTETTFYVLAVYFGSVGVKNVRHAMAAGIVADVFGAVGSVVAVNLYLSWAR
jgi:spore maturation protein SpmA